MQSEKSFQRFWALLLSASPPCLLIPSAQECAEMGFVPRSQAAQTFNAINTWHYAVGDCVTVLAVYKTVCENASKIALFWWLWVPGGGLEPFRRVLLSGGLLPPKEKVSLPLKFLFRGSKPPESKTRLNGSKPPLGTQRHQNNAMQT